METPLLPLVKPAIGSSLSQEFLNKSDEECLDLELAKITEENPAISHFIQDFAKRTDDAIGTMFGGVLVYKLLRSQAECDRMAAEIPLD